MSVASHAARMIRPFAIERRRGASVHDRVLSRNQRVELVTIEAAQVTILDDPSASEANEPQQWAVTLNGNTIGKPIGYVCAQTARRTR